MARTGLLCAVLASRVSSVSTTDDLAGPAAGVSTGGCGTGCRRFVFPDAVQTHGARCLDGSPPGFYTRPGVGAAASNVMVYSHGGSWCYDVDVADTSSTWNCAVRASTYEGSSKFNPTTGPPRANMASGIMSPNCTENPRFCEWTVVYFMYCDGSSFTGDRAEPHQVDPARFNGISQVWSRGKHNLHALWDRLLDPGRYNATAGTGVNLRKAARVVVTGASAGGFSTFYHCDTIRSLVPATIPLSCVPDCGFWPDLPAASGQSVWHAAMAKMTALHNATGGFDVSCVAANPEDPSFCAHPPNVVPFITTPVFISTSHQDTDATSVSALADGRGKGYLKPTVPPKGMPGLVACFTSDSAACVGEAGRKFDNWTATITALLPAATTPHGWFVNRCYRHHNIDGLYTFDTFIGGVSLIDAIGSWVLGLPGATRLVDARPATIDCTGNHA